MGTTWYDGGLAYGFDTETTSADPKEARVLTAALVRIENGVVTRTKEWIISPVEEVPAESIEIHGLTTEWLRANGRPVAEVLPEVFAVLRGILGSRHPLAIFNAAYDLSVMQQEAGRLGIDGFKGLPAAAFANVIDPHVLGKGVQHYIHRSYKKGQNFKLPSLCAEFEVPFEETHGASADAVGAALLAQAVVRAEPALQRLTRKQFFLYQRNWRQRQAANLQEYFDKNNIEREPVDTSWPFYAFVGK